MLTEHLLNLNLHLKLVGLSLIVLGVSHAFFGRRFGWKEEFARVSLLNRQIFYVHCFFIALVVSMLGVLCLVFTEALLEPSLLGRVLLSGIVLFWACRLGFQFFVYDASLWRGHPFNTRMHILFALLWSYYVAVFSWALWQQLSGA
jgi:hypothetical protein